MNTRRAGLATARSARRTSLDGAHKTAMDAAIDNALSDAFYDTYPEADDCETQEILESAEQFRSEYAEFRDYLRRPVGETVARFCELLNLDPTCCIKDGEAWMFRSPPHEYETTRHCKTGAPIWPTPTDPPP